MTQFDILFAASGAPALADQFGEAVTYKPRGGGTRAITAIRVVRHPPSKVDDVTGAEEPTMEIEVYNNSTTGISSAEIDTGGDLITVASRFGAVDAVYGPADRRVNRLLSDVAGVTRIEVR